MNYSIESGSPPQSSPKTLISTHRAGKTAGASSSAELSGPTLSDNVNISPKAKQALMDDQLSTKIDDFLASNGESLYATLLGRPDTPENLATKLDDPSIPPEERSKLQEQLNQREMNAFFKYAKESPPNMKMYFEKYAEYLDSLSFEERQSSRYKAQRAEIIPLYEGVARDQGFTPKDLTLPEDPTLRLFELIRRENFKIDNIDKFEDRFRSTLDSTNQGAIDNLLSRVRTTQEAIEQSKSGSEAALNRLEDVVSGLLSPDNFFG